MPPARRTSSYAGLLPLPTTGFTIAPGNTLQHCFLFTWVTCFDAGAAALEKLDLVPIDALAFYREYDEDVGDPLATFVAALNHAGSFLGPAERDQLFNELPSAFQKTSLLLTSIAAED